MAQMVKNLGDWVLSLGWEDPLEKGMATHSSILAWRIPWTEESGGCGPWGHKEPPGLVSTFHQVWWAGSGIPGDSAPAGCLGSGDSELLGELQRRH